MEILVHVENIIFKSNRIRFILASIFIELMKVGVWFMPNLGSSRLVSQHPFSNFFQNIDMYIIWNWLSPFMAWCFGLNGEISFFLFHLFCSFLFTLVFIALLFRKLPDSTARKSLMIFLILPVSGVSYYWVGMDSVTLLLMTAALFISKSLIVSFVFGVLIGMQHFEQGLVGFSGLFFCLFLDYFRNREGKISMIKALSILFGVLMGKVTLYQIFEFNHMNVDLNRIDWLQENLSRLMREFSMHFQAIVWSVLGLGWLVALRFFDLRSRSYSFFISLGSFMLLLPFISDYTRVMALITFPLISVYWLMNAEFLEKLSLKEVSSLFLLWVIMPWSWMWGETARGSVFSYDLIFLLHSWFGWFDVPADIAVWPF